MSRFWLVVFLSFFDVALCGAGDQPLILASGNPKGVYFAIGQGIAEVAPKYDLSVKVEATRGSTENVERLRRKQAHLAFVQSDIAFYAFHGKNIFSGSPLSELRGIVSLYTEAVQILVRPSLFLKKVADLKGKRVSVGPQKSGTEFNSRAILEAAGITFDEIRVANFSFEESVAALRDGSIDAAFIAAGVPTPAVEELAKEARIALLPLDFNLVDRLVQHYPYFVVVTIPANTYESQNREIPSVGVRALLVCPEDLGEQEIYGLTKALFSEVESLANKHPTAKAIELSSALRALPFPLHPGARRYYYEQGLFGRKFGGHLYRILAFLFFALVVALGVRSFNKIKWFFRKRRLERILAIFVVIVIFGSVALHLAERHVNENFETFPVALWSVLVYFSSGFGAREPITPLGQMFAASIVLLGAGTVTWLTATLASIFIEARLQGGKRMWGKFKNHFVVVNWNNKSQKLIEQLHNKVLKNKATVVVVADPSQNIVFPETAEFEGVYLIPGEPTNEVTLKRANVQHAHSVVILSDPLLGAQADAKSVVIILVIRRLCGDDGVKQVHIVVEILDPEKVKLADHAGRESEGSIEVVSAPNLGLYLLSQAAVTPGLTKFYEDLLSFTVDTNDVYRIPLPKDWRGKSFSELGRWFFELPRNQAEKCLIPIGVIRNEQVHTNPTSDQIASLEEGDEVLLISWGPPLLSGWQGTHGENI